MNLETARRGHRYLFNAELPILRSAGFQTCRIADFQVGPLQCSQRVWKPATQQTWKSALRETHTDTAPCLQLLFDFFTLYYSVLLGITRYFWQTARMQGLRHLPFPIFPSGLISGQSRLHLKDQPGRAGLPDVPNHVVFGPLSAVCRPGGLQQDNH
jgi:hypothetical protein